MNIALTLSGVLDLITLPVALIVAAVFAVALIITAVVLSKKCARLRDEREKSQMLYLDYAMLENEKVARFDAELRAFFLCSEVEGKAVFASEGVPENKVADAVSSEHIEKAKAVFSADNLKDLIERGATECFECRMAEGGDYRLKEITVQGAPKADKFRGVMVYVRDIDDVRRDAAERREGMTRALITAENAGEMKSNFLTHISHEIRTPLNAAVGYLNLAQSNVKNPALAEDGIKRSLGAAKKLEDLLNDILDMSSVENEKIRLYKERFSLAELLSTVSDAYYGAAKSRGLGFGLSVGKMREYAVGDKLRIKQILSNVLSNALKFTKTGNIKLAVSQRAASSDTYVTAFTVTDTGIGIPDDYLPKLFDPFEQAETASGNEYGGLGLGLAISRGLVKLMNGSFTVSKAEGGGTAFRIEIPLGAAEGEKLERPKQSNLNKVSALVVDGDAATVERLTDILDEIKVLNRSASNGKEAMAAIRRLNGTDKAVNICFIDEAVFVADEHAFIKELDDASNGKPPMLVIMTYDIDAISEEAKQFGIERFVEKPLFARYLFRYLINVFGNIHFDDFKKVKGNACFIDKRVLVAVADGGELVELTKTLESFGLEVVTAMNGKALVDIFCASPKDRYDCILTDAILPDFSGYEAAKRIRASSHVQAQTVPIIAMTDNAFDEEVPEVLQSGMNDHLAKPIDTLMLSISLAMYIPQDKK